MGSFIYYIIFSLYIMNFSVCALFTFFIFYFLFFWLSWHVTLQNLFLGSFIVCESVSDENDHNFYRKKRKKGLVMIICQRNAFNVLTLGKDL